MHYKHGLEKVRKKLEDIFEDIQNKIEKAEKDSVWNFKKMKSKNNKPTEVVEISNFKIEEIEFKKPNKPKDNFQKNQKKNTKNL